jgi:hypothetical protein
MEKSLHPNACRSKFFSLEGFTRAWLDRRRSCEQENAQVLNATEFIELEIEDQGDNNFQVEFAPLVFNPSSERILEAIRDVEPLSFNFSVCG